MKLFFDVVAALIKQGDKILVCQRMPNDRFGSQWEFPGGKVEKGEEKKIALKRELMEELGLDIEVGSLIKTFQDEIPIMKIHVFLYECSITGGTPQCIECEDIKWATIDEIRDLNLAPADKKIAAYLNC